MSDVNLKDIDLLRELDAQDLAALEEVVVTRVYKKNSVVVTQGDETDSLYLIVSGSVRVYNRLSPFHLYQNLTFVCVH